MKRFSLIASFLLAMVCAVKAQDSAAYAEYFGKYKFSEGSPVTEVEIAWMDNQLNISSAMGNAMIEKAGVDSFSMDYENGIIVFSRDSSTKKINGLTIYVSGMALEGKKDEESQAVGLLLKPAKKEELISFL